MPSICTPVKGAGKARGVPFTALGEGGDAPAAPQLEESPSLERCPRTGDLSTHGTHALLATAHPAIVKRAPRPCSSCSLQTFSMDSACLHSEAPLTGGDGPSASGQPGTATRDWGGGHRPDGARMYSGPVITLTSKPEQRRKGQQALTAWQGCATSRTNGLEG